MLSNYTKILVLPYIYDEVVDDNVSIKLSKYAQKPIL